MVAESTVIFFPMLQLGWRRASAAVIPRSSSRLLPKKGPPDAVSSTRRTSSRGLFPMDWKMAECSLSTGRMETPFFLASSITRAPPHTKDSLLARARVCPASRAATVGESPATPTRALSTMPHSSMEAASKSPSSP